MALSGNYIKYSYTPSLTETEFVDYTYPLNLYVESPDYDKRGTTIQVEQPVMTTITENFENVYLIITGVTIEKSFDLWNFQFAYRLFPNTDNNENIDAFNDEFLFQSIEFLSLDTTALPSNPYELAYEHLKTQPSCANMTNA